ncbi:hypothetical protein GQ457_01G028840 [Hibiscus cannabinus]
MDIRSCESEILRLDSESSASESRNRTDLTRESRLPFWRMKTIADKKFSNLRDRREQPRRVRSRPESRRLDPEIDQTVESKVRDEILGWKNLHGGGTRVVAGFEPLLDAGTVVGNAGTEANRRFHQVKEQRRFGLAGFEYKGREGWFLYASVGEVASFERVIFMAVVGQIFKCVRLLF